MLVSRLDCRPPAHALTMGGRWEQLRSGAATHLPFRAGHNQMHTAKAGWGEFLLSPLLFIFVNFFHFVSVFRIFILETKKGIGYNTEVYAKRRIFSREELIT